MAEALARHYGHEAESAGTHPGSVVASNSLSVLKELGVSTEAVSYTHLTLPTNSLV